MIFFFIWTNLNLSRENRHFVKLIEVDEQTPREWTLLLPTINLYTIYYSGMFSFPVVFYEYHKLCSMWLCSLSAFSSISSTCFTQFLLCLSFVHSCIIYSIRMRWIVFVCFVRRIDCTTYNISFCSRNFLLLDVFSSRIVFVRMQHNKKSYFIYIQPTLGMRFQHFKFLLCFVRI